MSYKTASHQELSLRKRKFEETSSTTDEHIEISLNINSRLPPEMLEKVFSFLGPKDLKTVMLVCKTWNNTAEASPLLWSWVKIRFLPQASLKRLHGAREVELNVDNYAAMTVKADQPGLSKFIIDSPKGTPHEFMQAVLQHPGLKKFSWGWWWACQNKYWSE